MFVIDLYETRASDVANDSTTTLYLSLAPSPLSPGHILLTSAIYATNASEDIYSRYKNELIINITVIIVVIIIII